MCQYIRALNTPQGLCNIIFLIFLYIYNVYIQINILVKCIPSITLKQTFKNTQLRIGKVTLLQEAKKKRNCSCELTFSYNLFLCMGLLLLSFPNSKLKSLGTNHRFNDWE